MTIAERIAELQNYARLDRERYNESSIADVLAFPSKITGMDGPYLFLEESGNVRALWRNAKRHFGIDFYGEGKARLIVFFLDRKGYSESYYFSLIGLPSRLSKEGFLTFVKEHVYGPADECTVPSPSGADLAGFRAVS